ncbi:hypothetical protein JOQ06_029639 [Pogonophryne albipinna]|uniref:Uncharacterized protein n=1 Tax=Pogonophryne albipinna TaxID=1090488 RepID=A0AAD6AXG8_9TELE|nr:hypothetical protein JOQ06_029639 [Pogonophryne albipinna]
MTPSLLITSNHVPVKTIRHFIMDQMTVLPLFDYGDTIYRSACKGVLDHLDVLYHSAIRFATNAPYRTL